MKRLLVLSAALVCGLGLAACASVPGSLPTGPREPVDMSGPASPAPQPIEVLKQMAVYLRSLDRYKVRVEKLTELILPSEQRLHGDQTIDIAVDRPNLLRVDYRTLSGGRQVFYDGKTFTIYTPAAGVYAVGSAPSAIDATLETLYNEYQIELPVADLLSTNTESRLVQDIKSSTYVGQILVNGARCHHLAFRTAQVDWEIWIEVGAKPLPRRLLITDKSVEGTPTMVANLIDWQISPSFPPDHFSFRPPAGAARVPFLGEVSATLSVNGAR